MEEQKVILPIRSIWSLIATLGLTAIIYSQAVDYLIPGFKSLWKLRFTFGIEDITLIAVPIITYLLIAVWLCMVCNIFKKLKPYREEGIIYFLIWLLIAALIWTFIVYPFFGLIVSHLGLVRFPFVIGLFGGVTAALIGVLIFALYYEFK